MRKLTIAKSAKYLVLAELLHTEEVYTNAFEDHRHAFNHYDLHIPSGRAKVVYKVIGRNPLVLGAINVSGSDVFSEYCPVRAMEYRAKAQYGIEFRVI